MLKSLKSEPDFIKCDDLNRHDSLTLIMDLILTFQHDCKSKTLEVQKKNLPKRTDWSHVKSSGYGTKTITKSGKTGERTGRPRISPRITAKVEEAKKERMKSVAEKKKSVRQPKIVKKPIVIFDRTYKCNFYFNNKYVCKKGWARKFSGKACFDLERRGETREESTDPGMD